MRERYEVITFDMGYTLVDMDSFGEILQRICAEEASAPTLRALIEPWMRFGMRS